MKKLSRKIKKTTKKLKYFYAFSVFYLPTVAVAKLSDRSAGFSQEGSNIFGEVAFWFQLGGAVAFLSALYSLVIQKKNKQPLSWEVWGMVGGAALVIGLTLLSDTAGTLKGEDVPIDAVESQSGF